LTDGNEVITTTVKDLRKAQPTQTTKNLPQEGEVKETKAPAIKAQVVGTTAGFNTIIDGGLGKQKDPRTAFTSSERSPVFETQPNNNESSFLDISLPSLDNFGRQGGIQIRFELPNGVDANTVFEEVVVGAALTGRLDATDPNFQQKVQGLVDRGIAKIQGLTTGGAKQTAQVKETVSEKQVAEPLKDVESTTKALEGAVKTNEDAVLDLEGEANVYINDLVGKEMNNIISNLPYPNAVKDAIKKHFSITKNGDFISSLGADRVIKNNDIPRTKTFVKNIGAELLKQKFTEGTKEYSNELDKLNENINVYFQSLLDAEEKGEKTKINNDISKIVNILYDVQSKYEQAENNIPNNLAEAYHKAKADKSNPDLVQAVEDLLAPKETAPTQKVDEGQAKPIGQSPQDVTGNIGTDKDAAEKTEATDKEVDKVAEATGTKAKNIRDLYDINRKLFGQDRVKSLAAAVAMDRMIGVMAKRAGTTKAEMYARIRFQKASETDLPQGVKMQVDAWHGSPYEFDKFTTEKIGTGEGAQAFGWGLYFTDLKGIAEGYANMANTKLLQSNFSILNTKSFKNFTEGIADSELIEAILNLFDTYNSTDNITKSKLIAEYDEVIKDKEQKIKEKGSEWSLRPQLEKEISSYKKLLDLLNKKSESDILNALKDFRKETEFSRNLYKVSLHEGKAPSDYTWLEWDKKPNKEQVNDLLSKLTQEQLDKGFYYGLAPDATNGTLYKNLAKALGGDKQASLFLLENGIDGVKYPAESISRGATSDTARGFNYVVFDENAVSVKDVIKFQKDANKARGAAMVAMDGNAVIYALTDPNVSTPLHEVAHVFEHYLTDGERATINNWAKTGAWTTETSEKFARGFEKYLSEGIAPTEGLKKVFEKFKTWLTDIYNGIKGSDIDIELNDDMRSIYAKMLGEDAVPAKKAKAAKAAKAAKTKPAIPTETIDKLVGKATDRRAAVEAIADENIKEVAKAVTDTKVIDKVMDAIDNNDQLLADLEKKLGMKKICKVF
jgi:hypothetical protein